MALSFDCQLQCVEESFRVPDDTIVAAIDAEFVTFQCDNDPDDGDGCEMVVGILVDTLPPFDGRTLPASDIPLKVACVDMEITPEAKCGSCFDVRFEAGVDGEGVVPVKNIVSVENGGFLAESVDCQVCVNRPAPAEFIRGDCNASNAVDIADTTTLISFLFAAGTWKPVPPCVDACDANDDGRIDIADAQALLSYVTSRSDVPLPPPGPVTPGTDTTADKLECVVDSCP